MRRTPEMKLLVAVLALAVLYALLIVVAARSTTPTLDRSDCPPDHVYIDYGETPQRGCVPVGMAVELGIWPKAEEGNL